MWSAIRASVALAFACVAAEIGLITGWVAADGAHADGCLIG